MENKKEVESKILEILALFSAAYPTTDIADATPKVYMRLLADIPPKILEAVALDHISRSPWFPKVSELRHKAAEIIVGDLPDEMEAWGIVQRAIRYADQELDVGNSALMAAVEDLGYDHLRRSTNQTADRARFADAYKAHRDNLINDVISLPMVKKLKAELENYKKLPKGVE